MATFMTELDESGETIMLLEAETTGAFSKSELEIKPNPLQCYKQSIGAIGTIAKVMAHQIGDATAGSGADVEVTFGIKIDGNGSVMIASMTGNCQLTCTLKFAAS